MSSLIYVFHNSDYAGCIDKQFSSDMKRIDMEAFSVEADVLVDDRDTWMFKGCSNKTVNKLLKVISVYSEDSYVTDLSDDEIRVQTVPYDCQLFKVGNEDLYVCYSIKSIKNSKLRKSCIGPQDVSLYEKDIPHFGPILVFKGTRSEVNEEDTSITVITNIEYIESNIEDIKKSLSNLNFGG